MSIHYATMLVTDGTASDSSVGLYNGSFCWVSDRPGYNGAVSLTTPPINPVTSSAQLIWKQDLLIREGLGSPSYSVDMLDLGSYGTVSDMDLQVKNTGGLSEYLRTNQIHMTRRAVRFYVIVDEVFTLWWSGVVDSISFSESVLKIKCVDAYNTIHKEFPPEVVERVKFPNAKDDVVGKPIPVCIGKVTRAKLLNIKKRSDRIAVYNSGSADYYETVATAWQIATPRVITLKTGSLSVAADAWKGKYHSCIRGGPKSDIRIAGNTASASGLVVVTLEEEYRTGSTIAVVKTWLNPITPLGTWYFSVMDLEQPRIISDRDIASIESSESGSGSFLDVYEDGEYLSVSGLKAESSLSNIAQTGMPGFLVAVKSIHDGTASQNAAGFIHPTSAVRRQAGETDTTLVVVSGTVVLDGGSTWPAANGTALPLLIDRNKNTGYSVITKYTTPAVYRIDIAFDLELPEQAYANWEDGIYLMLDFETQWQADSPQNPIFPFQYGVQVYMRGKDVFGSVTDMVVAVPIPVVTGAYVDPGTKPHLFIHPRYYDSNAAWTPPNIKSHLNITSLIQDWKSLKAYPTLDVKIVISVDAPHHALSGEPTFTVRMNEAVIQTGKRVDVFGEDLYTKVKGTTYETTWYGRKTPSNPVDGVVDAAESFFQLFDGASTYIDTASFDNTASARPAASFAVGRQIQDRKNSIDYLIELCKHGHFCIVPLPNGQRRAIPLNFPLLGPTGPTLDEADWIAGSLSEVTETPIRRCFNEIEFAYDYDHGLGKCKRSFFVRNVEQSAFPLEATLRAGTGIQEWKFWVGGIKVYALASTFWSVGRTGYLFTKTRNTLRLELPWFISNEDWGGDSDADGPINLGTWALPWVYLPKKIISGALPINATTLAYSLGQDFRFSDPKVSPTLRSAKFTGLRLNTQKDIIEASTIFSILPIP